MKIADMRIVAQKQIENCIKDQKKQKKNYSQEYLDFIGNISDVDMKAVSDGYWREVEHGQHYDERVKELLAYMFEQQI